MEGREMAYWKFAPESRLSAKDTTRVTEARECPGICGGRMQRLAERQFERPYAWRPVGYRCDRCGSVAIDTKVSV